MAKEQFWIMKVDGILMDDEAEIRKQEKRSSMLTSLSGNLLVLLGLFTMWMWLAMTLSGQDFYFGAFGPVFAVLVSAAGVVLTVYGIRKKV